MNMILKDVMEGSYLFNEMCNDMEDYFKNYKIEEWLTQSQVKMLSEILLSGNKINTLNLLKKYKELQLKRNIHKKDKWKAEFENENAIEKLYNTIENLSEIYKEVIENMFEKVFENMNKKLDYQSEEVLIYQTLIQKFNYLFVMKYLIKKKYEV